MKLIKRACIIVALFLASVTSAVASTQVDNFSFKDINGKTHQFADYRGKWVVVNYWATYCAPCVAELPALNSVAKRFKDKVVVLGMEAGETPRGELKQFANRKKISYPVVPTQDSTMFALGLIYGVPTTFVVNPQGQIVETHMGAVTARQLQKYIRSSSKQAAASKKSHKEECDSAIC